MTATTGGARGRAGSGAQGRASGFTLIELVIAIAIVAILSVIAVASYNFAVVKTRRAAAEGCMMQGAQYMERYYTTKFTYVGAALPACESDVSDFYNVGLSAAAAKSFTIQGAPISGKQDDPKCGTLTITNTGTKGSSGSGSVEACW